MLIMAWYVDILPRKCHYTASSKAMDVVVHGAAVAHFRRFALARIREVIAHGDRR